jgi:hypothetical protein
MAGYRSSHQSIAGTTVVWIFCPWNRSTRSFSFLALQSVHRKINPRIRSMNVSSEESTFQWVGGFGKDESILERCIFVV